MTIVLLAALQAHSQPGPGAPLAWDPMDFSTASDVAEFTYPACDQGNIIDLSRGGWPTWASGTHYCIRPGDYRSWGAIELDNLQDGSIRFFTGAVGAEKSNPFSRPGSVARVKQIVLRHSRNWKIAGLSIDGAGVPAADVKQCSDFVAPDFGGALLCIGHFRNARPDVANDKCDDFLPTEDKPPECWGSDENRFEYLEISGKLVVPGTVRDPTRPTDRSYIPHLVSIEGRSHGNIIRRSYIHDPVLRSGWDTNGISMNPGAGTNLPGGSPQQRNKIIRNEIRNASWGVHAVDSHVAPLGPHMCGLQRADIAGTVIAGNDIYMDLPPCEQGQDPYDDYCVGEGVVNGSVVSHTAPTQGGIVIKAPSPDFVGTAGGKRAEIQRNRIWGFRPTHNPDPENSNYSPGVALLLQRGAGDVNIGSNVLDDNNRGIWLNEDLYAKTGDPCGSIEGVKLWGNLVGKPFSGDNGGHTLLVITETEVDLEVYWNTFTYLPKSAPSDLAIVDNQYWPACTPSKPPPTPNLWSAACNSFVGAQVREYGSTATGCHTTNVDAEYNAWYDT